MHLVSRITIACLMALFIGSAHAKDLVVERSFTISYVKVPKGCKLDEYKSMCTRLVNYYVRRYEREMVSYLNELYDQENLLTKDTLDSSRNRVKSVQHINMSIYSKPGDPIMTLFSIFKQKAAGQEKENLVVETINFEAASGKVVRFDQLFENPKLAAMLCARMIESKYQKFKSPLLQVVISATELSPSNFLISPNGLRFFFAPGLVKPNTTKTESMLVPIEALKPALPVAQWWSNSKKEITKEEREALAKSDLAGVIDLDADHSPMQEAKQAREAAKHATPQSESLEQAIAEEPVPRNH